MSSGWSGLVLCIILGKRLGFGKENFAPHSMVLTFIGASMLWVGWYGFNSGSAVAADVIAANAFTTTTIATAVGSFVWPMWEWIVKGKPSVLGFCSGAVAGLVLITPACGYVLPSGAIWIGIAAGTIPWFFCYKVKGWLGYGRRAGCWSVHGIGGMCGAIMTGMFARQAANPNLATNLSKYVTDNIFQPQLCGAVQDRGRHHWSCSSWARWSSPTSPRCWWACGRLKKSKSPASTNPNTAKWAITTLNIICSKHPAGDASRPPVFLSVNGASDIYSIDWPHVRAMNQAFVLRDHNFPVRCG